MLNFTTFFASSSSVNSTLSQLNAVRTYATLISLVIKTEFRMVVKGDQRRITRNAMTLLQHPRKYVEIKCQLDSTEFFIADLTACSTCFGYHYAHQLRVMCPVCRMLQHPANRTHNPQLHTRPAT